MAAQTRTRIQNLFSLLMFTKCLLFICVYPALPLTPRREFLGFASVRSVELCPLTPGRLLGQEERHVGGLGRALRGQVRQQLLAADKARGILEMKHYSLKMREKVSPGAVRRCLGGSSVHAPCSWPRGLQVGWRVQSVLLTLSPGSAGAHYSGCSLGSSKGRRAPSLVRAQTLLDEGNWELRGV